MKPIIRVENLDKQYRIGARQVPYSTLRESVTRAVRAPFRRLRGGGKRDATETIWALKDINFDVLPGEVIGVIGRNGSGKSTLLKILSRITEPTRGRVELYGRVGSLLEVGTGFHPELTGRENIFLNGAILGMARTEITAKFDEIVEFAEIEKFIDTPVKHYSSGMYTRLAFSVAAQLEPEILLVDEVLAVGDAAFQKKCLGRMGDVARQGRTVFLVSHNIAAISSLCRRAIVLESGKLIAFGAVEDAVRFYAGSAVRGAHASEYDPAEWRGDAGDEHVRLHRTWIRSLDAEGFMHTAADIEIGVELDVRRKVEGLILGFWLLSTYDTELAYTRYDDDESTYAPTVEPGRMVKKFIIPANTLGAGTYKISFDVGIHMVKVITQHPHGSLVFSLENVSGIGRRFSTPAGRTFDSLFRPQWKVV